MIIGQSELFRDMNREFVKEIMDSSSKESFEEGDVLFQEGGPARHFYIMLKGRVRLRIGEVGQMVHSVSRAGEGFGWSSLVGRAVYSATAECLAPTKVIKFDNREFEKIVQKDPNNGQMFYRQLARLIGERLVNSYNALRLSYPTDAHSTYGSSLTLQQTGSET